MAKNWITKEQVEEMDRYSIDIFAWTPNIEQEWTRLENLGIQGLITDMPDGLSRFRTENINAT